jgi:RNA polymerase sigma-70 factor (ECF subfamily)
MQARRISDRQDRRLLARVAEGDRDALEEIYEQHADALYSHVQWMLGHNHEAEDVMQALFLKLATMGADLLGVRKPRSYMFQMAHRIALRVARDRQRRGEESTDFSFYASGEIAPESRTEVALAERALAALQSNQREAIYLHLYQGFTFREIGKIVGIPTHTAASRYRVGLQKLRMALDLS